MKRLKKSDYGIAPTELAVFLLGKVLAADYKSTRISGRIIETEAYGGGNDLASHGNRGATPRNQVMFGPPGHLYVYFTYGMHYCSNVVAGKSGECAAVLLRALEPLSGIPKMEKNRFGSKSKAASKSQNTGKGSRDTSEINLCSGPAKLTQALGITTQQNGIDLTSAGSTSKGRFCIYDDGFQVKEYKTSPRIGISSEKESPETAPLWRYYIPGNPNLSRKDG